MTLPSNGKLTVLVDSGATTSIISETTVKQSAYLSSLPVKGVPRRQIKIADGSDIVTDKEITLQAIVQGHEISISAYIVPTMGLIPSLLGNNDLEKLRAVLDFRNHTVRFQKPRSSAMRATRNIILQPGQSKHVSLTGRMPVALKSGDAVLNSTQLGRKLAPGAMLVTVSKGSCTIPVKNLSKKTVTIHNKKPMGFVALLLG